MEKFLQDSYLNAEEGESRRKESKLKYEGGRKERLDFSAVEPFSLFCTKITMQLSNWGWNWGWLGEHYTTDTFNVSCQCVFLLLTFKRVLDLCPYFYSYVTISSVLDNLAVHLE